MKVRYRLVFCRGGVLRGDGRGLVHVEASQGRQRMYFSSNVYLFPEHWDRKRMMVVGYPNADALNAYLFEMVVNLERAELDLWKRGLSPTLAMIRERVAQPHETEVSFVGFCESAVMNSKRQVGTKKSLMGTLRCLARYREGCSWGDLTYSFVRDFELYLLKEGYAAGTVVKHLRNLRTLVNEAVAAGYFRYEDNPYKRFKITHQRSVHKFLSP